MLVFSFAKLDGTESVIELGADRTGLFAEVVALTCLGVIKTLDGADDGGSTTSTGFLESGKLLYIDRTTLDLHTHILSKLHKTLVGDRWKYRGGFRSHIDTVLDAKEVGSACLVNIFLLLGVQIELTSIFATVAGLNVSAEGSSVVTADLIDASSERSRTVELAGDDVGVGLEASLEVWSHRSDENHEEVLVGRFHTHGDASADKQRTEIEACAGAIRRDETLVEFHHLFAHLNEFLCREFGHHDATAGALQTLSIGFGTEDADLAVFAAIGFQSFESFLAIVETGSCHVHLDVFRG